MEKEYIVSLNDGVNYLEFWEEMETSITGHSYIPDRTVDIVNERPGSQRSCHYALTDSEVAILRNDPRVYSVELPPEQRSDIQIGHNASQTGNFTKPSNSSGDNLNWGLLRCINQTNIYGTGTSHNGYTYDYHLDGTGVDIVIQDSGLQIDHPEFTDSNGNSRVQLIDWYSASGLSGTQSANHYRDYHGHGTHVAGISAGRTYGWAKNARIYSVKVNGLEGTGDSNTGISVTDAFDVIKLWHLNKPVDPVTGLKRPTVVNMSWGYSYTGSDTMIVSGGTYRGSGWLSSNINYNTSAKRTTNFGIREGYTVPARVGSVDVDVAELIEAGVIVCIAAGNAPYKIDSSVGSDYNNIVNSNYGSMYYHRGSSPYSANALMVGVIDSTTWDANTERITSYASKGPGVDIWAPGSRITSAASNINEIGSSSYYLNNSYQQSSIGGSSMATPQIAGIATLYLQANPGATPAEVKDFLLKTSKSTIYSSGLDSDYSNTYSLLGGSNRMAYFPFGVSNGMTSNNLTVSASLKR